MGGSGSSILGKDKCGRDASRAETPGGETARGHVGLGSAACGNRAVGEDGAAWGAVDGRGGWCLGMAVRSHSESGVWDEALLGTGDTCLHADIHLHPLDPWLLTPVACHTSPESPGWFSALPGAWLPLVPAGVGRPRAPRLPERVCLMSRQGLGQDDGTFLVPFALALMPHYLGFTDRRF